MSRIKFMRIRVILLVFSILTFSNTALSFTANGYNFCSKVHSGFIADHLKDRAILVNYEASSDYFVFLRCGKNQEQLLSSSKNKTNCHVYRAASGTELCSHERSVSKLSAFFKSVLGKNNDIDFLNPDLRSLVKVNLSALKAEGLKPNCLGGSLLKNIAVNKNVDAAVQSFFIAHKDLSLFLEINEFKENIDKNKFVFDSLDQILVGDNGSRRIASAGDEGGSDKLFLRGPAYMKTIRSNMSTEINFDKNTKIGFCSKFPNISSFDN